jgi:hypothetical protein
VSDFYREGHFPIRDEGLRKLMVKAQATRLSLMRSAIGLLKDAAMSPNPGGTLGGNLANIAARIAESEGAISALTDADIGLRS